MLVLLSAGGTAHAVSINDGYGIATGYKKGAVMARAVVLDDNGQPILVEYNEDGSEAGVVPIPGEYRDRVNTLRIIGAHEYLAQQQRLALYREQHAQDLARDASLMTRDQFLGQRYRLADNRTEISPPSLPPDIHSVLVRGQSARLLPDPKQLVLLSFTVDLTQEYTPPAGTKSLVLTPEGQVIAAAPRHIGPRTGFFGDASEAQRLMGGYDRDPEDDIFGPVSGVKVSVVDVFPGGVDVTGADGKYYFTYRLPPCPGFTFEYTTDAWAELYYANFSPLGAPILPYYLRRQDWDQCIGILAIPPNPLSLASQMDYAGAIGILAGMALPDVTLDFWVDVMLLTGDIHLQNPGGRAVNIGGQTDYAVFDRSHHDEPVAQTYYDFDGDGRPDTALLGKLIEEPQADGTAAKVFYPVGHEKVGEHGDVQGVYLSSRGNPEGAPDLIRRADTAKNTQPTGLLASISEEDLQATDLLVFREATGELVLERQGLREAEVQGRGAIGLGKGEGLYYRLMLRGPRDGDTASTVVRAQSFTEWTTRNHFTEPFRPREADHLKSGEWVRLIAINRRTGYVGSQRVQLSDASQGGLLSFPVPSLVMSPPNLRVWAERSYDVAQGLTQGEDRQYLVGAEGASLTSDAMVTVYTEWLDADGRPLPEGLGAAEGKQYGLTGRLAKVVAANTLAPATDGGVPGGDAANFPIGPGLQKQVLQLKDSPSRPEHYYIHVSGTQFNEGPSFDTGTAAPPLDSRPGKLTPFLTPLYDEDSHWQEYNAYRDLKREQQGEPDAVEPLKPLPAYAWQYRPEYQFSRLSLEIDELNRVSKDEAGGESRENIIDVTTPVVASSDDLIEILYSLIEAEAGRLDPLDGPQELVFAVGEEEIKVQLGEDRTIRIENLDHLARLDPEDFLTMRLYVNQDAGNVLWEYAFGVMALLVDLNRDGVVSRDKNDRVNADKPFRFWINDDDDNGEIAEGLSDVPGVDPSGAPGLTDWRYPDYTATTVGGASDLVDYFTVGLDIRGALDAFPPSQGHRYLLRHAEAAFNFIYTDLDWSEARGYLTDFRETGFGPRFDTSAGKADKMAITAEGVPLSDAYLNRLQVKEDTGLLLMDVRKATAKPLELVVKKDNREMLVVPLHVKSSGVEEMFRHVNLAPVVVNTTGQPLRGEEVASRPGEPPNYPDKLSNDKWFVFIHGYNVTQEMARGWQAESFKRLHQLGSNARFVGVTWHGDTGVDYHQAVKHAFVTGSQLRQHLPFVSGDVTLAAHSLGNMVASQAIAAGGFAPSRYYLINAAVPIEAYDSGQTEDGTGIDMLSHMTEDSWKPYRIDGGAKLFADSWHSLFTDNRRALAWADRFRNVLGTETYNFYSTGEDVVENASANETVTSNIWDAIWAAVLRGEKGRHAWVAQEIAKGSDSIIIRPLMGVQHGGWGYNREHFNQDDPLNPQPLTLQEAMALGEDVLRTKPYFRRFQEEDDLFTYNGAALYAPDMDENASTEAGQTGTQYKLLAEAIPARSFAAAANGFNALRAENNIDMMGLKNQGRWPMERLSKDFGTHWWHSDFRSVALVYTSPMWQKMIQLGELDQCVGC